MIPLLSLFYSSLHLILFARTRIWHGLYTRMQTWNQPSVMSSRKLVFLTEQEERQRNVQTKTQDDTLADRA